MLSSPVESGLKNFSVQRFIFPDHKQILAALIKKDARAAKLAMWQHLENVKQRLLEFSNVDDIYFDGYLFDSWPLDKVDV